MRWGLLSEPDVEKRISGKNGSVAVNKRLEKSCEKLFESYMNEKNMIIEIKVKILIFLFKTGFL